jgi:hypothetical protein
MQLLRNVENGPPIKRSEIEGFLNPLHDNSRVPRYSGLLIGLSLFSYQVRELLVCWLFFILPLVMLGLLILGGMVAYAVGIGVFCCPRDPIAGFGEVER